VILDNLKTAGVQQAQKEGRIAFTALAPWPGELVAARVDTRRARASSGGRPSSSGRSSAPSPVPIS
jgi:hypothetical protein